MAYGDLGRDGIRRATVETALAMLCQRATEWEGSVAG
jgi:hypothetical protein